MKMNLKSLVIILDIPIALFLIPHILPLIFELLLANLTPIINSCIIQQQFVEMQEQSFIEDYKILTQLGSGGQARVYLGLKNQQLYAIKMFKKVDLKVFNDQVNFLQKLQFKYIVSYVDSKFEGSIRFEGEQQKVRPIVVMEYVENGDGFDYIAKCGPLDSAICRRYFQMLIEAVQYLQDVGITHRDIKLQNILIDHKFYGKVTDFGLSSSMQDKNHLFNTKLGTEGYRPPEMQNKPASYTGLQADLFACAVCLFIMKTGTYPFQSTKITNKRYKLLKQQKYERYWDMMKSRRSTVQFEPEFKDLLNSMFNADVEKRLNIQQIMNHPWLQSKAATDEQLYIEMKRRYDTMKQKNEQKNKIDKIKLMYLQQQIKEQEEAIDQENRAIVQQFLTIYRQNIEAFDEEKIPKYNGCKIIELAASPAFLMAWLSQYLLRCKQKNQCFIEGSSETYLEKIEMEPSSSMNSFIIRLFYQIDEQFEVIKIEGNLYRLNEGKIGLKWDQKEGNGFWVRCVISGLNTELQALKQ